MMKHLQLIEVTLNDTKENLFKKRSINRFKFKLI